MTEMSQDNTLVVFSESQVDRNFLQSFFQDTFGHLLHVLPLTIADAASLTFEPRAVIATITSKEIACKLFPYSKIIYGNRVITGYNLEKVMKLPTNTTALVVSTPREIAEQTAEDLCSLGIKHLNLIPYWPSSHMDISDYDIVIYAGFRSYCPEGKDTYIDIGHRRVTVSVLTEIIKTFDLPSGFMDSQYHGYVRLIIDNLYSMNNTIKEIDSLKKNMEQVINLSEMAIFVLDNDKVITVFNPIAEKLFCISASSAVGKSAFLCLNDFPELNHIIEQGLPVSGRMIEINHHYFLLSIASHGKQTGCVIRLESVDSLQAIAEKARTDLRETGFQAKYTFADIKGESSVVKKSISIAQYYAKGEGTILILGESGTGKELFAQSVHRASRRCREPFVAINFGAIPENLVESELFGYEEGAFTGASKGGKKGLFRSAHKGTIFLDEIGDASLAVQTRLLRVLEEREVTPVGSSRTIPIDVRIVCATNKNLEDMVAQGKFRDDLYYRLKVLVLTVPPLRQRRADIPDIINSILTAESPDSDIKIPNSILTKLMQYNWPGNIRELKSLVQNLAMFLNAKDSSDEKDARLPAIDDIIDGFLSTKKTAWSQLPSVLPIEPDSLAILSEIRSMTAGGMGAGRYSLSKNQNLIAIGLTESRIKNKCRLLEKKGYLTIGSTKQGMRLTEEGEALLPSESN